MNIKSPFIDSYKENGNLIITLTDKTIIKSSFLFNNKGLIKELNFNLSPSEDLNNIDNYKDLKKLELTNTLLVVGCGSELINPSFYIKKYLNDLGMRLEWLNTINSLHAINFLIEDNTNFIALIYNN